MASETVSSIHSAPSQEADKEVKPEVNKIEAENVSTPPKESVEDTKPLEESLCPEEKQIEPPVTQDVKVTNDDEKPKPASAEVLAPPLAEPTDDKIENKPVVEHNPPAEDETKTEVAESTKQKVEDKPVAPLLPTHEEKKSEDDPCIVETASITEPTIEKADSKVVEAKTNVVSNEEKPDEQPAKEVDVSESLVPAEVAELPVKVMEAAIEAKPRPAEETSETAPLVEQKQPPEQIVKEAEPVEEVQVKIPTDKVGDTKLPQEDQETCPVESSDQVESAGASVTKVEEKNVAISNPTDEGNEPAAKETIEVKGLSEVKAVEPGNIEAELIDAPQEKSVVAEKCEEKPADNAEKVAKDECTTKDVDLVMVTDDGNKKDEAVASDETIISETKEQEENEAAEKVEENVQATEAKLEEEKQVDEKTEDTVQASETKLEEEKQVDEPVKTDVQIHECTKDSDDMKTSQDVPKTDAPVKTQKQSIVKIVKQSLAKAKKAITGKQQHQK